ncbi:MAG TPA: VOC family protein [Nocardioides sp.]|uniref:VOC family protein n=1 Tax=uncultured Nocardioides sp. TaxID=198441 RepID=UPI000EE1DF07|nr:VOC family protein [uncultured Nocardioides sp.]HCB05694.1 glyoxalase-like domain protein [Nocardioides sp.]HRD63035.1 VOC family protein [Nocardioides sp.]HRI96811.1 VOC family protein [Nocardioides sp.]HRK46961.1 VOC family protein [Nocardioides sp.]
MYLENLVIDALDPQQLGRFWEAVVGGERLTDAPGIFETRMAIEGGPAIDLCFPHVPETVTPGPRLHVDLLGGQARDEVVERLLGLGARHLDIGQADDVPWVVLADPEGNPLCVMGERAAYADTGPIAGLPLDSADPERDTAFWSWLTGWVEVSPQTLRHPSRRGPLLQLCPEESPKGTTKNRLHLDIRLEGEDQDAVEADIAAHGGRRLETDWGELPWRSYLDPSGNEFCVLRSYPSAEG